jgi:cellulose synthase/poly-beta-1,6-N-acetylglucosamine synthase-like glycosyltransferase
MAYNEEAGIGRMMEAVLAQQLHEVEIAEIVVVASGCTDRTEEIVREFAEKDARIRLLIQPYRSGKSSAINMLLSQTEQEIIVSVNADTVPAPDAVEQLVKPFIDPTVGMTGGRPIPTNDPHTFMGYAVHLLWELHHQIALRQPKLGELIAFRNFFHQIPTDSAVDEASIEPLIRGQGLKLHYAPDAIVYNRGPETIADFIRQRRRIYAGHIYVHRTMGYRVSTMKTPRIMRLLLFSPGIKWNWQFVLWGPIVVALEAYARMLGALDYSLLKRKHAVWEVVETTKAAVSAPASSPSVSDHNTPPPR